ncbi:MAG: OmpA family protein [Lachnospiraceae bacterium]|nr:OmpA family protein [Lachnospiraceae bacterium]
MKNRRKSREAFAEHSFWQSYSDMMAALLLIFILIIAITLAIYRQKTTDLEETRLDLSAAEQQLNATIIDLENSKIELENSKVEIENSKIELEKSNADLMASLAELKELYAQAALTQDELNKAYLEIENAQNELATTKSELQDIVGIRTDIIGALQSTFNNSSMSVDAQTGSIAFSSDVMFAFDSAELNTASKASLKEVIPKYLDVLLQDQYREYIAEIIIEGHTDTNGSYKANMQLSYDRASAVANFCLDEKNGLTKSKIGQLQSLLTVNGRSYSDPVYKIGANGQKTNQVDMAASRRVEIKFRLKEDEMIKKISEILNQ